MKETIIGFISMIGIFSLCYLFPNVTIALACTIIIVKALSSVDWSNINRYKVTYADGSVRLFSDSEWQQHGGYISEMPNVKVKKIW
jgi:hypothetical protein